MRWPGTFTSADTPQWAYGVRRLVVLSGAGVSTDSGIPDFRGPSGAWTLNPGAQNKHTYQAFLADPELRGRYWKSRYEHPIWRAKPNAGHLAVAALVNSGIDTTVVTQNTDGLHQQASTPADRVIELHGTMHEVICVECGDRSPTANAIARIGAGEAVPQCLQCGGTLKTASTMFGQTMSPEVFARAEQAVTTCDLLLAVGTTLTVEPAAPCARARLVPGRHWSSSTGIAPPTTASLPRSSGTRSARLFRTSPGSLLALATRSQAEAGVWRSGSPRRFPCRPAPQSAAPRGSADRSVPLAGRRTRAAHGVVRGRGSADPPRVRASGVGKYPPGARTGRPARRDGQVGRRVPATRHSLAGGRAATATRGRGRRRNPSGASGRDHARSERWPSGSADSRAVARPHTRQLAGQAAVRREYQTGARAAGQRPIRACGRSAGRCDDYAGTLTAMGFPCPPPDRDFLAGLTDAPDLPGALQASVLAGLLGLTGRAKDQLLRHELACLQRASDEHELELPAEAVQDAVATAILCGAASEDAALTALRHIPALRMPASGSGPPGGCVTYTCLPRPGSHRTGTDRFRIH